MITKLFDILVEPGPFEVEVERLVGDVEGGVHIGTRQGADIANGVPAPGRRVADRQRPGVLFRVAAGDTGHGGRRLLAASVGRSRLERMQGRLLLRVGIILFRMDVGQRQPQAVPDSRFNFVPPQGAKRIAFMPL